MAQKLQDVSTRQASRLTRNDAEIGGSLEVGYVRGTATTDAFFKLPSLTTDQRNALTAEEGMVVYDSTLGLDFIYRKAGWGQTSGTAAASLDAAYNGGATITVDAGAVTLTDTQTTTGGGLLITKSGKVTSTHAASVLHINSTGAHDTSGALKMLEISVGSETVSGGIYGIEIEMNANTDSGLEITTGAIVVADGAVTLTSGDLTVTSGDLTMTDGSFTYTAGDMAMSDGSLTITDADNANSLAITNNTITTADLVDINSTSLTTGAVVKLNANNATHSGEVLEIISAGGATTTPVGLSVVIASPTTGAARGIEVTMVSATTTAKGIVVTMDAITTGDMLYLDNGGASMTGDGKFINCNDDDVSAFSVAANGLTTIAGSTSGTDALVITAGDILVTSGLIDMTIGDLTLADGSVTVTDADNAASLSVTNNTITTGAQLVSVASTSITTGALMTLNANCATHSGEVLELISASPAAGTATGMSVVMASVTTGAAIGIDVTMVGATTTAKGIAVTMDALTTGDMLYLDNGGSTMTEGSGFYINCNDDNVSDFTVGNYGETDITGKAAGTAALTIALGDLVITDTDASTISSANGTGTLLTLDNVAGVIASDTAILSLDAGGAVASGGNLLRVAPTGTPNAGAIGIEYVGAAKAMTAMYIDGDPTASDLVTINCGGALTADLAALAVNTDGALATGSNAFRVDVTGTPASGAIYAEFDFAGLTDANENIGVKIDAGGKKVVGLHVDADPVANSAVYFTSGAVLAADKATLEVVSVPAGNNADSSVLRLEQTSTTGAGLVATLVQGDVSEPFINFECTEGAGNSVDSTATTEGSTIQGFIRLSMNGSDVYLTVHDTPTGP